MPRGIFRQYDIRGLIGTELSADVFDRVARAVGTIARERGMRELVVGYDCRESSPAFAEVVARALNATGIDVVDVGCVTTPLLYFAIAHKERAGGIQITASHNPPEYNGLKICLGGTQSVHGDGLVEVWRRAEEEKFAAGTGTTWREDVAPTYVQFLKDNVRLGARRGLKLVVDAGNGTGGVVAVPLYRALGFDVDPLFCEMDGRFPNHHPDPTDEKNLADLKARVRATGADLGIAFDGDADRLGIVDERGDVVWGDRVMIVLARALLREAPGAAVLGEVKCSQTLYDDIERHGGKPILWKTGHSLIKAKMKESGALLAGEMSGHIFYAHRYYGFDDALYASLRLLEVLTADARPMSQHFDGVPRMYATPEIRVECADEKKFDVVARVTERFRKTNRVIDIDGARVLFDDGWGLVRASNTGPILVLRFEATSDAALARIRGVVERAVAEAQ
ncbi:MAG: phosphomannomutase/phosphoglucomutase [Deltaproteobacteria bacterium]|nr:phosphomannomutase/phosphoglucomutase [Deltaproteobacteria bacterium]